MKIYCLAFDLEMCFFFPVLQILAFREKKKKRKEKKRKKLFTDFARVRTTQRKREREF